MKIDAYLGQNAQEEVDYIRTGWPAFRERLQLWFSRCGWLDRNVGHQEFEARYTQTCDLSRELGEMGDGLAEWVGVTPGQLFALAEVAP